ncbi:sterile alpha motif domain-containing protein 1-like [Elephas maximus indicus]|uniref:sterile alpha motif domain-containing protein 1-like n=1 Tax=Elephas maximus indicus TaxID=99487 RepID=UPI002116BA66|nr:sterile alpha motif domain-containing protein 1-like [Elephas maximus indicus]
MSSSHGNCPGKEGPRGSRDRLQRTAVANRLPRLPWPLRAAAAVGAPSRWPPGSAVPGAVAEVRAASAGTSPAFRRRSGLEVSGRPLPALRTRSLGAGRCAPAGDGPRRPRRSGAALAPPRSGGRSAVSPPVSPPRPARPQTRPGRPHREP